MAGYRLPVLNEDFEVVETVVYNENLDFWDGFDFTCGIIGMHKGITKLKNGKFVLIRGTQWEGEIDYAETISDNEALQEILKSGNHELLELEEFKTLKDLNDKTMIEEDLEEEVS